MTAPPAANPVAKLLEDRKVKYFAVIDDAFGPPVRKDFGVVLDSFWSDLEEDEPALQELNDIAGAKLASSADLTDQVLAGLHSRRDALGALAPHYAKHLASTVQGKLAPLNALVGSLETDLKRDVTTHTSVATFNDTRAQIIFIDFYMGPAGEVASIRAAKDIVTKLTEKYAGAGTVPLLVLMSASEVTTAMVADFQESTGWVGGMFHFVKKQAFLSKDMLTLKLAGLLYCLPAGQTIQRFIDGLKGEIHGIADKFIADVSKLGVEDYAYIQVLSLQEDGHPLGDYMLWLYSSYFGRLLFGGQAVRELQKAIDRMTFENLPPTQTSPSSLLGEIYKASLFDMRDSELGHPRAPDQADGGGPADQPYLQLGDLFLKDADGDVYMVLNAQCDLAFTPDSHHRPFKPAKTVLLIPGKLHPFETPISEFDANKPRTELFEHDDKVYRILWDTKRVTAQPFGEFGNWLRANTYSAARYRLRLPFALQVQQLFASDLTRVGMPVAPPLSRPVAVQLWGMSGEGKAEVLTESQDSAFLFLTRRGEQCLLKEELAHEMKGACAKAVSLLEARIQFLSSKNAGPALERLKAWHNDLTAFAQRVQTLFDFRDPFLVPPGKDPFRLGNQPVLVARGAAPGGTYRFDQPLLINIVTQ
jgi:hypothetical protein